jgi:predicted branched-subunit amino acid permease
LKSEPEQEPNGWRTPFLAGASTAARGPMLFLGLTFLGIGGLGQQAGIGLGPVLLTTVLIWAGPAQVIFIGSIMNGLSLPAIALSISLSSVRLLPMCVSLLPWLRPKKPALWKSAFLVHQIAVTAWVESIRRLPDMPAQARLPWFLGFSQTIFAGAFAATIIGYGLAVSLPRELAAALLFVTPVYFTLALVRNARDTIDWSALAFGFALTPVARIFLGPGFDLLFIGLVGGTAAWMLKRALRARSGGAP